MTDTVQLVHNRVQLALHHLRAGGDGEGGWPLLLLHGLGERSPAVAPEWASGWPGPVWALDFTGHGLSSVPLGGGYTAEVLMGDADAALAHLGEATIAGRGVGAYVALLIAGARPGLVRGAILRDGPGLAGGGTGPESSTILPSPVHAAGVPVAPDPWALLELARDVRPPDYASAFARQATQLSGLSSPLVVAARSRAPWLDAVVHEPGVLELPIEEAVALYAAG
jgi:pimeloyl-ACP methyl ester carboxylesterase